MHRVNLVIQGRVRAWDSVSCCAGPKKLGLTCWVQNLPTVKSKPKPKGPEDALRTLIEAVREGTAGRARERVSAQWRKAEPPRRFFTGPFSMKVPAESAFAHAQTRLLEVARKDARSSPPSRAGLLDPGFGAVLAPFPREAVGSRGAHSGRGRRGRSRAVPPGGQPALARRESLTARPSSMVYIAEIGRFALLPHPRCCASTTCAAGRRGRAPARVILRQTWDRRYIAATTGTRAQVPRPDRGGETSG